MKFKIQNIPNYRYEKENDGRSDRNAAQMRRPKGGKKLTEEEETIKNFGGREIKSLTHGRNWYILLEYSDFFFFFFCDNCSSCLFKFNSIQSIFKSSFLPNRISNSAQISPFQRSSDSFVNRKRSDSCLRQKFMRRNPKSSFLEVMAAAAVFILVVVEVVSPILDILVSQDLRPVRDVDRQRRCRHRRYAPVSGVDRRNPL